MRIPTNVHVLIFGYNIWPFCLNYLPPTKLRKGNVITDVCYVVQGRGGYAWSWVPSGGWVCLVPGPFWGLPGPRSFQGVGYAWSQVPLAGSSGVVGWVYQRGQVYQRGRGEYTGEWVYHRGWWVTRGQVQVYQRGWVGIIERVDIIERVGIPPPDKGPGIPIPSTDT